MGGLTQACAVVDSTAKMNVGWRKDPGHSGSYWEQIWVSMSYSVMPTPTNWTLYHWFLNDKVCPIFIVGNSDKNARPTWKCYYPVFFGGRSCD